MTRKSQKHGIVDNKKQGFSWEGGERRDLHLVSTAATELSIQLTVPIPATLAIYIPCAFAPFAQGYLTSPGHPRSHMMGARRAKAIQVGWRVPKRSLSQPQSGLSRIPGAPIKTKSMPEGKEPQLKISWTWRGRVASKADIKMENTM